MSARVSLCVIAVLGPALALVAHSGERQRYRVRAPNSWGVDALQRSLDEASKQHLDLVTIVPASGGFPNLFIFRSGNKSYRYAARAPEFRGAEALQKSLDEASKQHLELVTVVPAFGGFPNFLILRPADRAHPFTVRAPESWGADALQKSLDQASKQDLDLVAVVPAFGGFTNFLIFRPGDRAHSYTVRAPESWGAEALQMSLDEASKQNLELVAVVPAFGGFTNFLIFRRGNRTHPYTVRAPESWGSEALQRSLDEASAQDLNLVAVVPASGGFPNFLIFLGSRGAR